MKEDVRNKLIIFASIGLFLSLIIIIVMTGSINKEITGSPRPKVAVSKPVVISPDTKLVNKLTPSRPEDYGMIVYSQVNKPQTQQEWDQLIEEGFAEAKKDLPQETTQAMATLKRTEEEYAKRIQEVEARMKIYEDRLSANPDDEEAKMRLEKLRILKAIGNTFKEDIVVR